MLLVRRSWFGVGLAVMMAGSSLPGPAAAQTVQTPAAKPQTTVLLPQGPLLPAKFGAWTAAGPVQADTDLTKLDLPGADILKEDGAERFATGTFKGKDGSVLIHAVQFGDASGAYSAFTDWASQKERSARLRDTGEEAMLPGPALLLRRMTTMVLLSGASEPALRSAARQLEPVLPKIYGPKGQLPLVPTLLPSRGLVTGSIRYALGPQGYAAMGGLLPADVLGFDKDAEVVTAQYDVHGSRAMLMVLLYPTPQIAGQQGRAIEAAANAGRAKFGSTLKMRRDGVLVAMGWGDLSGAAADALIKSANLHQEFSWDHAMQAAPDLNTEVHKTASLLQNILVLSSVLGAGAILLGLFLGFGRASIRVLMGKPAATEQEFLSINLRAIPPGVLIEHSREPEAQRPNAP